MVCQSCKWYEAYAGVCCNGDDVAHRGGYVEEFDDLNNGCKHWEHDGIMGIKIPVVLDEGAYMPTKAHEWDAGFDLKTPKDEYLMNGSSITIDTGVHMAIPDGYVGMLKSKSGLNVKHGITCDGTIDAGYTGSIRAKLYNDSREPYQFQKGDKITQIVIIPIPKVELVQTDTLEETDRGSGGFGSSGR